MTTIENLPQELIAYSIAEEPSIFDCLNHTDKANFSIALAGTIHEEFVTENFCFFGSQIERISEK